MYKYCFQFPGQGSQVVGMGKDLYNKHSLVRKIYEEADDVLNLPISKLSFEGPIEDLTLTANAQPALLTVEYALFHLMLEYGIDKSNSIFLGHSLGEYSALTCAGILEFKEALRLVHLRGKFMQEAVPSGRGAMLAVVRLNKDSEKIALDLAQEVNGVCEPANFNSPDQIVFSGETDAIASFNQKLGDKKIRSIPLKVSAPFHCSMMEPARLKLNDELRLASIGNFEKNMAYIPNISAKIVTKSDDVVEHLSKQVTGSVFWRQSLEVLNQVGFDKCFEIGPGQVLNGLMKKTLDKPLVGISNLESLQELNYLGGN